jgi:hypothetical protein
MTTLELKALDGYNPLGFLAACGVLVVLTERSVEAKLAWRDAGRWIPTLTLPDECRDWIEVLFDDLERWRTSPALELRYGKTANDDSEWDLKPPPERFRRYLEAVRRTLPDASWWRHAGAFAAEGVTDNSGKTKPFALHFTAGQQAFLEMVGGLLASETGVTRQDLSRALLEGWTYDRPLPVLGWDATSSRDYALRARNPSGDKKLGNPGADWLAFRALGLLRSVRDGERLRTTGCSGSWKDGVYRWPLWTVPASLPSVRALINLPEKELSTERRRDARGVACVLESGIRRSDQGGYGSFTPSRIVADGE